MSDALSRPAVATGWRDGTAEVTVDAIAHTAMINLRGRGDAAFASAVESATGLGLPIVPNTVASSGDLDLVWLGPDEWSVNAFGADSADLLSRLGGALAGVRAAVTDVRAGFQVFLVNGPSAADLLARGTALDLAPERFVAGCAARTVLAKAPVLLYRRGDAAAVHVIVRRSMAGYLQDWFTAALARMD